MHYAYCFQDFSEEEEDFELCEGFPLALQIFAELAQRSILAFFEQNIVFFERAGLPMGEASDKFVRILSIQNA